MDSGVGVYLSARVCQKWLRDWQYIPINCTCVIFSIIAYQYHGNHLRIGVSGLINMLFLLVTVYITPFIFFVPICLLLLQIAHTPN